MYFESHVNVAMPDHTAVVDTIGEIAKRQRMKISVMDGHDHLFNAKTKEVVITGHAQDPTELETRMRALIFDLINRRFKVTRYKIEQAIVDSRVRDEWGILT